MENLKEFETIKALMDFMVESAESDHFYEGGAVLNGQFIKYRVIIPSEMEYDIKEAIAEYKK